MRMKRIYGLSDLGGRDLCLEEAAVNVILL